MDVEAERAFVAFDIVPESGQSGEAYRQELC